MAARQRSGLQIQQLSALRAPPPASGGQRRETEAPGGAGEGSGTAHILLRQNQQPGPREKRNAPTAFPAAACTARSIFTGVKALCSSQTPLSCLHTVPSHRSLLWTPRMLYYW